MKNKFLLSLQKLFQRINPAKTPVQVFVIDPTAKIVTFKILNPIELYYTEVFEEEDVEPRVRPVVVKPTDDGTVALSLVDNFYVGEVVVPYGSNVKEIKDGDEQRFVFKTANEESRVNVFLNPSSLVSYVKKGLVEIVGIEY